MSVAFDLAQFPKLKFVVAYGPCVLPSPQNYDGSNFPDFILVVEGGPEDREHWHFENSKMNPSHYSILTKPPVRQFMSPFFSPFFNSPMAQIRLRFGSESQKIICNYAVLSEEEFFSDLKRWDRFFAAPRMQKPVFLFDAKMNPSSSAESSFSSIDIFSPQLTINRDFRLNDLQSNLCQSVRAACLMLPPKFSLSDLISKIGVLSHLGDIRNMVEPEELKASRHALNFALTFCHMYLPAVRFVSDNWILRLNDGDQDFLTGRYQAEDQRKSAGASDGDNFVFTADNFGNKFSIEFENRQNDILMEDVIKNTKQEMRNWLRSSLQKRLSGDFSAIRIPPNIKEATDIVTSKNFILKQSYSPEAQCSMFNLLPEHFQVRANGISARERLLNILSPFSLLDNKRGSQVLGGPLPYEKVCVSKTLRRTNLSSSRRTLLSNILSGGGARSSTSAPVVGMLIGNP